MTLFIKNMVCMRCIRSVSRLAAEAGLEVQHIQLGEVTLTTEPVAGQMENFREALEKEGFELLDDRNKRLVMEVKNLIINEIHHDSGKKPEAVNFSDFLAKETGHEYSQLSKLFSAVEGLTIEKYIIAQKVERVKELLIYDELTLSEISWKTGYSSSQHLSNQFRQVTGLTPTQFKAEHRKHGRKPLDEV
ncbi:MAG: helix-turn-helix transcriptional regulator [Saprospiraceae bacterium]|nr:helix-turn-helix transcriptional regulator [Saprospiraceae bacterium]